MGRKLMLGCGWAVLSDWGQRINGIASARELWVQGPRRAGRYVRACFWADRDRWLMWIPVALGGGIAGYFSLPFEPHYSAGLAIAGLAASIVAAIVFLRPRWEEQSPELGYVVLLFSFFVLTATLGFVASQLRTLGVAAPVLQQEIGPVTLDGRIESAARQPKGDWRLVIVPARLGNERDRDLPARVRVSVRQRLVTVSPGMNFEARVMLMPPPGPVSPDGFDFARQAWFQGIGAVGYSISTPDIRRLPRSDGMLEQASGALRRIRQAIAEHIRSSLPGAEGAIAAALLTGDREAIPESIVDSLRASGLAHLLAISGLHMALVGGLIFATVRAVLALIQPIALNYSIKKWAAGAGLVGALLYLLVSGASISTQRAFIMISIMFVAVMLDRPAVSMRNVAIAATFVLLTTPESLLHVSFQMSFAAVVGLVAVYEWRRDRFLQTNRESWAWAHGFSPWRLVVAYVVGVTATTAIAEIMIGPIAAFHFNRVATLGIVANLVAVPLVGFLIMPMGVLALMLVPTGLEQLALVPMAWGIEIVIWVSATVSSWSAAEVATPAWPQYALILIMAGGLWLALWRQSWRYAGVGLILIGIGSALAYERPDMLIDRDGSNLAVRSSDGDLLALSTRKSRFAVSRWLQGEGLLPDHDQTDARARLYKCDALGCITVDPQRPIVAFATDPRAFAEDCLRADFIVANVPLPRSLERSCRRYATVIDRFDLLSKGAHAVWFEQDGPHVVSAAERRGSRPWSSFRESLKLLKSVEGKDASERPKRQARAVQTSTNVVR